MNEYIYIDNDNILEPNINSITLINNEIFNKDLIESYKTEVDAIKQFTLDFNRETIYINNIRCLSIDHFILLLSPYNRKVTIGTKTISLLLLSIILSCQSSYFYSYNELYKKIKDNSHIVSHLSKTRNNKIYFEITNDLFECKLKIIYQIIDIAHELVLNTIKAETVYLYGSAYSLLCYKS